MLAKEGAYDKASRSPHGERGLKLAGFGGVGGACGRSPHGERGLKCAGQMRVDLGFRVALLMESVD